MAAYEKSFLMKMLENMWTVRKFEECAAECSLKGEIKGNVHVCLGEEGAVAGANMALDPGDYITISHRGHGHCVVKSGDVDHVMAELFGKESGFCRGRGGSMHVTHVGRGLLGANGIVGGGIPLATGSALASLANGDSAVSVAFFGDGASNQGCFHECLNMAALWNLPVIYFIQNNQFAVSTNIYDAIHTSSLAQRGQAYDIYSEEVDGTDVLAVYETMRRAVEHARSGKGPVLIECRLYRFTGHFIGDPARYIPEAYLQTAHELDAIEEFKRYLLENQIANQEELDASEKAAARRIEDAREFARQAPAPDVSGVLDYNYACGNERSVAR